MMNRVYIQSTQLGDQEPVRQKDPVHFRSLMLILFTCSVIVIGILSYIWRGVEIISIGYKMRAVYYQQTLLQDQRQKLILERAALRSLKRIEHIASSELELVKPNPEQVIILPAPARENKAELHVQPNVSD
ncbi:MAG TPA: cell division protein FtsL [Acidobacteriota bacterium]|nr:cell division protein FtsL [Acidobacteriota bacterium]